jgi:predicted nuclease of predicted toxin-antitoxin system
MKLLLDEDVPKPLLPALQRILTGHEVVHVDDLHWKSKKDLNLLPDAAGRGFDAILTNDSKQLEDAEECRAIRDSGLHHIRYRQ